MGWPSSAPSGRTPTVAGSNEVARHARSVNALTLRPMNTALPPDADFVDLEFLPPRSQCERHERATTDAAALVRSLRSYPRGRGDGDVALTMRTGAGSGAAPPAPPPDITFAAHSSLDLPRESTARSIDLLFDEPSTSAPAAAPPDTATEPMTRG